MSSLEIGYILPKTNHVNGVGVTHTYFNATDKVMKYITFTYTAFNPVGDQVKCTVSGNTFASGKLTGPIEPNYWSYIEWDTLWYNPTVSKVILTEVHIEYMDGSEETIDGKDVVDMDEEGSVYYETIKKPAEAKAAEERAAREKKAAEEKAAREKKAAEDARKNEMKQAYYCFMVFKCFKKMKGDDEMKFHVNQGLWLFILEVIGVICGAAIPMVGSIIFIAIFFASIFLSAKCIGGITNDKRFDIPLLSKIRIIK